MRNDLASLVVRVQRGDIDAYGTVVQRFQDMACGYAYAILGDFHLAQDAAQEAFVEAHRTLANLREPRAFPGWFRRIVLKRCDRIARRQRGRPRPGGLDAMAEMTEGETDPAEMVERRELRERVLAAITALPEHERTATTLFYIDGYSQKDVAGFLEVPVTTIKSRLHAARARLREGMLDMVKDELQSQRPGPELQQAVIDELMTRKATFDQDIAAYYADGIPQASRHWAAWWHERRLEGVRANAAQYGIEPDETLPRMRAELHTSNTFREDFIDVPRRWGVPQETELVLLREFCREVGATPVAVCRWAKEGLPVLRYFPWFAYDGRRARRWVEERGVRPHERMKTAERREPLLLTLQALTAGGVSVGEALEVFGGLEASIVSVAQSDRDGRPPTDGRSVTLDPLWAEEWTARRPAEQMANARQYGLDGPTSNWLGVPEEARYDRVFEIRDLCRRLGLSPIDVIRWTREGMPCLRCSPWIRWDVERVAAWLAERGPLPTRQFSPKELDDLSRFVIQAVADGRATATDARAVLACWVGTM